MRSIVIIIAVSNKRNYYSKKSQMQYLVDELVSICGVTGVFTKAEDLAPYERDETMNFRFPFEVLVKPSSADEVSKVLKCCNVYNIPVTPRGGGSGVTGGALPVNGGIVLSTERLNKIISLNEVDGYVVAEAGVITDDLCAFVEEKGFYFPVSPTSRSSSFIGGNVAENAGSIHSCKYGSVSRYVLNLEIVLPTGEIIWTGANVSKNATGLDITHLFVGSEGIIGVITKVVFRLLPCFKKQVALLAAFDDMEKACKAVIALKKLTVVPSAVELLCADSIRLAKASIIERFPFTELYTKAHLIVELSAFDDYEIDTGLTDVFNILEVYSSENILYGVTNDEKRKIWSLRRNIGNALTSNGRFYRDIDICVPVSFLYQYIIFIEDLRNKENLDLIYFGHAFDGNLHTMLLFTDTNAIEQERLESILQRIYQKVIDYEGVISGEHGIGMLQKDFMKMQFSNEHLQLFKKIKSLFDPNGIMNPGKVL